MSVGSKPLRTDPASWVATVAGIAIAIVITVAALFGFVILPLANVATLDPLTAICRAVGLRPQVPAEARPLELQAPPTVSQVAWTPSTLGLIASGDAQKGQEVAQQCTSCHGDHGIVDERQAPNLAPAVIPDLVQLNRAAFFKQLSDYRSGSRKSDIMAPLAQTLSDRDMVDVTAYFAAPSANQVGSLMDWASREGSAGDLVELGIPSRNVPPCASCHAMRAGGPIDAPALAGQRAAYLERQLKLFRTGERANDIYGAMREIANKLTDMEIDSVARHYAAIR